MAGHDRIAGIAVGLFDGRFGGRFDRPCYPGVKSTVSFDPIPLPARELAAISTIDYPIRMTRRRLVLAAVLALVALGAASWLSDERLSAEEQDLVSKWRIRGPPGQTLFGLTDLVRPGYDSTTQTGHFPHGAHAPDIDAGLGDAPAAGSLHVRTGR
jgi:hypothetical protein